MLSCAMASAATYRFVLSPNSAPVNVRNGASKNTPAVTQLVTGTKVTVLGTEGSWTHIRTGNKEGYIMTSFLTENDPYTPSAKKAGLTLADTTVYVISANRRPVNLRSGTSPQSPVLAQIPSGSSAKLISSGSGWSKVQVGGKTGFVNNEYLAQVKPEDPKKTGNNPGDPGDPGDPIGTAYVQSVNSAPVNLRLSPSRTSSVLAELVTGTRLSVLSREGSWSKVKVNGKTGYLMNLYLSANAPGSYTPATSYTAYVTSGNGKPVRVRYGAGTGYHAITALDVDSTVTVLTTVNGWARIRCGNVEGYINSKYLTTQKP